MKKSDWNKDRNVWNANPFALFIKREGISLSSLSRLLGTRNTTLRKWILKPVEVFTLKDLMIISGATGKPLIYIIGLVGGINNKNLWYQEQKRMSIDMGFLDEAGGGLDPEFYKVEKGKKKGPKFAKDRPGYSPSPPVQEIDKRYEIKTDGIPPEIRVHGYKRQDKAG